MSTNPGIHRSGDVVLLQGPALVQCRALVFKAVRDSSRCDGISPSPTTRDLLQALDEAMTELRKNGSMSLERHEQALATPIVKDSDIEQIWISTATAATILGVSVRQAQRLAEVLGAKRFFGRSLSFDRATVMDYRKAHPR